ncbi:uncharacterized protein LODBEIA_P09430 [Lodderomyces beijingensis]|uniref:Major facilitator superfamily (MFS) profile domain-containing protein n=1 Tax=Lodderomyces beijingensis TaxID=1775926 RepID=A0ABP0ZEZ0_9ASCO
MSMNENDHLLSNHETSDESHANHASAENGTREQDTSSINSETMLERQVEANKKKPWLVRPSVYGVIFVVGVLTMSISMTDPTRQIVLFKLAANTVTEEREAAASASNLVLSSSRDEDAAVQSLVATYNQFLLVGLTVISLPMTAKYGELSNIYGRKPFFTALVVTSLVSRVLQYYLYQFDTLHFKSLLLANYVQSLTGGTNIISALANSYVSDITLPSKRTFAFGLASSATFVGQSFGPPLGTLLTDFAKRTSSGEQMLEKLQHITYSEWFILRSEVFIQVLLLIYIVTIFSESRNEEAREKAEEAIFEDHQSSNNNNSSTVFEGVKSKKAVVALREILSFFDIFKPLRLLTYPYSVARASSKHRYVQLRYAVTGLLAVSVLYQGLIFALNNLVMQYGIFKFSWTADDLAYLLTIISVSRAFSLIVLLPFLEKTVMKKIFKLRALNLQFDMIEYLLLIICLGIGFVSFVAFYVVKSTRAFFTAVAFFSIDAIIGPTMDSTLLKFYPSSKSASLFSANILLLNLVCIVTSPGILGIYKAALSFGDAASPFLLYALAMILFMMAVYACKRALNLTSSTTDQKLRQTGQQSDQES